MSTQNFYNDRFFDLYVWNDEECEFHTESELDQAIQWAGEKLKRSPEFFEISILPGYYSGAQMKVDENYYCREYGNPIEQDNEGCKLQWDLCRSRAIRKFESEKNWINKKFLPLVADYLGMRKLYCRGVFSNGEAIYEYAK